MIISLNWLKKFAEINLEAKELATLIGARLVEIEDVVNVSEKYKDARIVRVVTCEKLEVSDHLSLATIDDGDKTEDVERLENGLIQVVCGAPNISAGQTVVWLPPKSVVPSTFSKAEPFILGQRVLCGKVSNGMIASSNELDLSDDHQGILVLNNDILPGTKFSSQFELDDYLLDVENKSLTHRPDCFGVVGFAREVAAISGSEFETPNWLLDRQVDSYDGNVEIKTSIVDQDISDRYMAVVLGSVTSKTKSPIEIQTYLSRVGVRSINAIVDITNYLMLATGQPLHAFDYDKFIALNDGKCEIGVRLAREGEKLELLDGRNINLSTEDIVITSGDKVASLAGAMGGKSTAIDENTKNIIIESATFNLYKLRSTQMRHGIFSEAITRFTKGQPAELAAPVIKKAIDLAKKWLNAEVISQISDSYDNKQEVIKIELSLNDINNVLGSQFEPNDVELVLKQIGFEVETSDNNFEVTVPYWRNDIHIVEDIVEEIGRIKGFDNINPTLPKRDFKAVNPSEFDEFRRLVRKVLVRSGANEVLTYSFIHGDIIKKANQKIENSYRITNSISPDLQYYRQSLTPSLVDIVNQNIRAGYEKFSLFEINKVHGKDLGMNEENVPIESNHLGFVFAAKQKQANAGYYYAKKQLDYLFEKLSVKLSYKKLDETESSLVLPYESKRSALIIDNNTGESIGVVGEYRKSVQKAFKLPEITAGFEVDLEKLFEINKISKYSPISRYPASERDICFKVNDEISYDQIINSVKEVLSTLKLESSIEPVDIYKAENSQTKNITIRIRFTSHDHTLTGLEVSEIIDSISKNVSDKTGGSVI